MAIFLKHRKAWEESLRTQRDAKRAQLTTAAQHKVRPDWRKAQET